MVKFLSILALIVAAVSLPVRAETPDVELRVTAADPSGTARLGLGDPLYLRVSYKSAAPLRLQAKGFAGGSGTDQGRGVQPGAGLPGGRA